MTRPDWSLLADANLAATRVHELTDTRPAINAAIDQHQASIRDCLDLYGIDTHNEQLLHAVMVGVTLARSSVCCETAAAFCMGLLAQLATFAPPGAFPAT